MFLLKEVSTIGIKFLAAYPDTFLLENVIQTISETDYSKHMPMLHGNAALLSEDVELKKLYPTERLTRKAV